MKRLFSLILLLAVISQVIAQKWEYFVNAAQDSYSLFVDNDLIYVGMKSGVAVFDTTGRNFDFIYTNTEVTSIAKDKYGWMWFAAESEVMRYKNGQMTAITTEQGLMNNFALHVAASASGNVWLTLPSHSGFPGGYAVNIGGQWVNITTINNSPIVDPVKVLMDKHDDVWLISYNGFYFYDGINYTLHNYYTDTTCYITCCIYGTEVDSMNHLWITDYNGRIIRFDGEIWHEEAQAYNGEISGISDMCLDNNETLWMSTLFSLYYHSDGQWNCLTGSEDPDHNFAIHGLSFDPSNTLWTFRKISEPDSLYRQFCLSRFRDGGFENYFIEGFLGNPIDFGITQNQLWLLGYYGVSVFSDSVWTHYPGLPHHENSNPRCLETDDSGNVYIGSLGYFHFNGVEFVYHDEINGQEIGIVKNIVCQNSKIWILSAKGLFYFDGVSWQFTPIDNISIKNIYVNPDRQNECFLFGPHEIYHVVNGNITDYITETGFPSTSSIISIVYHEEQLWVATLSDGLFIYYDGQWMEKSTDFDSMYSMEKDPYTGLIWFITRTGTYVTDGNEYVWMQPSYGSTFGYEELGSFIFTPEEIWQKGRNQIARLQRYQASVEQLQNHSSMLCYPNPANETLYIEVNNPGYRGDINLCDAMGRIICTFPYQETGLSLPVANLFPGMYLIMAQGMPVKKILITR